MAEEKPKFELIAKDAGATDEGYIKKQVDYLHRRTGMNFLGKEAALAVLNGEVDEAAADYLHGNSATLSKLLSHSDPLKIDHARDKKKGIELRAAQAAAAIPYVASNELTTWDFCLEQAGSVAHEDVKDGAPISVPQAQVWDVAKQVSANGSLAAAQIREGKTKLNLIPVRSSSWEFGYDQLSANKGALIIEALDNIDRSIKVAIENIYQLALNAAVPNAIKTHDTNLSRGGTHETHILTSSSGRFTPADMTAMTRVLRHIGTTVPTATAPVKPTHLYSPGRFILGQTWIDDLRNHAPEYFGELTSDELLLEGIVGVTKIERMKTSMNIIVDNDAWGFLVAQAQQHGCYIDITVGGKVGMITINNVGSSAEDLMFKKSHITGYREIAIFINPYSVVKQIITGRQA